MEGGKSKLNIREEKFDDKLNKVFSLTGKRTLVVRLGMNVSSKVHGVGMVVAYVFHIWLFYAGYISKFTFFLMLIPAPIGLRQVVIG